MSFYVHIQKLAAAKAWRAEVHEILAIEMVLDSIALIGVVLYIQLESVCSYKFYTADCRPVVFSIVNRWWSL